MPNIAPAPTQLSDLDLIATVARLVARESEATADLIAALAEFDARQLYLGDGCASLFVYCTKRLRLSESAAYHRITAARAVRRFPLILDRLRDGALTLTAVGLLAPHLTDANHRSVLDEARHQGKRAIEEIVAHLHPRPDVAASVRKLPTQRASAPEHAAVAEHPPALPAGAARAGEGLFASPSPLSGSAGAAGGAFALPSLLPGADAGIPEGRALPSPRRPAVVCAIAPPFDVAQGVVSVVEPRPATRSRSRCRPARMPSCGAPRICCATSFPMAIRRRCWIAR